MEPLYSEPFAQPLPAGESVVEVRVMNGGQEDYDPGDLRARLLAGLDPDGGVPVEDLFTPPGEEPLPEGDPGDLAAELLSNLTF